MRHAVSVGSPLRGAWFVSVVRAHVPLAAMLLRDATYTFMETPKAQPEPPHQFHTISCRLFHTTFDGCVHRDEATLDNARHTHERNLHHSFSWVTPQLWQSVWAVFTTRIRTNTRPSFVTQGREEWISCSACRADDKPIENVYERPPNKRPRPKKSDSLNNLLSTPHSPTTCSTHALIDGPPPSVEAMYRIGTGQGSISYGHLFHT